ncbi:MAG: amidohydrolase [Candidatus Izemoplasmatales bacterium]
MRIPAFIDSHAHMMGIGYYQEIINVNQVTSIKDIIYLLNNSEQKVLVARGFNQDNLEERRMPTKDDLSSIKKPVVLFRICGHVAVVNQKMLDLMNIFEDTKQVEGGSFDYKSGIFSEKALALIYKTLPKPTKEDLKRYLINANQILLENGITKIASDDFSSFGVPYELVIEAIKEVDQAGLLDVSIVKQVNLPIDELRDFIKKGYANQKFGKLKMGPLKILADGSLGGRTAALNEPYDDDLENIGILTFNDNELSELVEAAIANDMDCVVHAIGDRTTDQVIKTFKKVQDKYPDKTPNNAIIHAQITNREQIELMKKYAIGAIVQPIFINSDIKIVNERIGKRSKESYLFKTMYDKVSLGFSTDSPVEPVNPFKNIYCAISRKSIDFPHFEELNKEEKFTVEEALKAYTVNNLPFIYEDRIDDYIEISKDVFNVTNEEIKDILVLKTFIAGKLVYERKN